MAVERRKSPRIVDLLGPLYSEETTAAEEAHLEEHIFEVCYRYKGLECFFDALKGLADRRRHKIRNRIVRFEGRAIPEFLDLKTPDDVKPALQQAHERHTRLFDAYQKAADSALAESDHKTHKLLAKNQAEIDCILSVLEAVYQQADDLGNDFLLLAIKRLPSPK